MSNPQYPFRLVNALLTEISCQRAPEAPVPVPLNFNVLVKVVDVEFPKLEVHLRLQAVDDNQPLKILAEVVGLFDLVEGQPVPGREIVIDFLNDRALFLLWPYLSLPIQQITAQMGTAPVTLAAPYHFELTPEALSAQPSAQ
jgi:hypothetical protein